MGKIETDYERQTSNTKGQSFEDGPSVTLTALTLSLPESNLESINVAVPVESVDETLVCDHSNESYRAVLSCGTVGF